MAEDISMTLYKAIEELRKNPKDKVLLRQITELVTSAKSQDLDIESLEANFRNIIRNN